MKTIIELSENEKRALDLLTYSETAEKFNFDEQRNINIWIANNLLYLYYAVIVRLQKKFNVKINSGYRCYRTNNHIKGAILSQHTKGYAADITCDDLSGMWEALQDMEVDQAIKYKTFIHVSYCMDRKNRNQYIDKTLTTK